MKLITEPPTEQTVQIYVQENGGDVDIHARLAGRDTLIAWIDEDGRLYRTNLHTSGIKSALQTAGLRLDDNNRIALGN